MTDYRRHLILQRISTRLAGITVANGYKSEVDTVLRYVKPLEQWDRGECPGFMFEPGTEQDIPVGSQNERKATLPVTVYGVLYAENEHPSDDIEELIGDFRKAILNGDLHWGTHPSSSSFLAEDTDLREGVTLLESADRTVVAFATEMEITYRYFPSDP